ncbi:MAG: hypothetical protein V4757_07250 [Pseudomonadota bacterium]
MLDAPNTQAPAVQVVAIVASAFRHLPELQARIAHQVDLVPVQVVDFYPEPKEVQCSQS